MMGIGGCDVLNEILLIPGIHSFSCLIIWQMRSLANVIRVHGDQASSHQHKITDDVSNGMLH